MNLMIQCYADEPIKVEDNLTSELVILQHFSVNKLLGA